MCFELVLLQNVRFVHCRSDCHRSTGVVVPEHADLTLSNPFTVFGCSISIVFNWGENLLLFTCPKVTTANLYRASGETANPAEKSGLLVQPLNTFHHSKPHRIFQGP